MTYEIKITKIEEKEVSKTEWEIIGKERKEGYEEEKDKWGYVSIPNIETVETVIYKQILEDKDFKLNDIVTIINQ